MKKPETKVPIKPQSAAKAEPVKTVKKAAPVSPKSTFEKNKSIINMSSDELSGKAENKQVLSEVLEGIDVDEGEDLLDNFVDSTEPNQEHETNAWLSDDIESY